MCEICKECGCCDYTLYLSAPEIGVEVKIKLDPNGFTSDEEEEIGMMVMRVVHAWVKQRMMKLLNPGVYGIVVN